jgi:hypothetical protein
MKGDLTAMAGLFQTVLHVPGVEYAEYVRDPSTGIWWSEG